MIVGGSDTERSLALKFDLRSEGIAGTAQHADGREERFYGWLGLLTLLKRATADAAVVDVTTTRQ